MSDGLTDGALGVTRMSPYTPEEDCEKSPRRPTYKSPYLVSIGGGGEGAGGGGCGMFLSAVVL